MKKLLGVVLAGLLSLGCVACGPKNETAVCTLEAMPGIVYEITFEAENDIIQTMTQLTTIQLSNFPEEEVELVDENIAACEKMYQAYSGVQYSAEVKEDEIYYEKLVIDMTDTETLEALRANNLFPLEGEANKISLDKIVEQLEDLDWKVEMK